MPKFLSSTEHNGDIIDINNNSGTAGQILSSLGAGNGIDWINQADITVTEAEIANALQVTVKNVSGGELTKGTVVHVSPSASPPSGNLIEVIAADYDDVAKMPAIGILKETIANEAEGEAVMTGALSGIATDDFTPGDELYVGADGALTNTKPQTAGQLIQKIAVCVKSHESNGLIKIFGAGRSNDVPLPLYIDNTNQRVGIGEPSPSAKLSVNGTTRLDGEVSLPATGTATASVNYPSQTLRFSTSAWDTNQNVARAVHWNIRNEGSSTIFPDGTLTFYEESTSYDHWKLKLPGRGSGSSYIHPDAALFNGRINMYESDTSNLNISLHPGGNSYFNGGNVGIGTTSPANKLDVRNGTLTVRDDSNVNYVEIDRFTGITMKGNGTASRGIQTPNTDDLTLGTNAIERVRIDSSGNVGIGTTSPNYKLDVNGLARFTDTLRVDTTSDTALQLNSTDEGPVYMSYARNGDRHAYVGFGGSSDQFTIMNEETAGRINLGTAGSTRVTILEGGNVGIGTTSPSQKLQVEGNSWIKGIYYDTSGDAGTSGQVLSSTATGTNWITLNDIYYTESEADARFVNVTGDTMTGTLTISNTSPVLILNDTNSSNTTNQIAFISLKNQGSETGWVGFGSGSNSDLTVKNTSGKVVLSGSSGVYIPNGNVGIGTTDPERLLSLYSNNAETTPRFLIEQDGTGDAVMAFSLSGGQGWSMGIDNSLSDSFMIHNSAGGVDSSSQFTINTSGDVGIGTTSPTHKLQVVGNGAFNSTLSVQDPAVSSNGLLQLSHDSTGSSLYSNPASSNVSTVVLRLGINYSEKMRIANNGNVGIGTTSPGEKLDVNGNISHKGLTMTEGTDVDQIKTFTMTYQLAANTWTDTGINSDDLSTGTYIMQVYADDSSAGASHYDEYYSATISWFGTATNSTVVDEIVVHRAGHAPNDSDLQFRTVRHSIGGDNLMLQVKTNNDHTLAMNNTNGRRHTYKFRKLI